MDLAVQEDPVKEKSPQKINQQQSPRGSSQISLAEDALSLPGTKRERGSFKRTPHQFSAVVECREFSSRSREEGRES